LCFFWLYFGFGNFERLATSFVCVVFFYVCFSGGLFREESGRVVALGGGEKKGRRVSKSLRRVMDGSEVGESVGRWS